MKKAIMIIGLFVIGLNIVFAQPPDPPCPGDCNYTDQWIYEEIYFQPDPINYPLCTISYECFWRQQHCNHIPPEYDREVQITSVQQIGFCPTYTPRELYSMALGHAFIQFFQIPIGTSYDNFRATNISCWDWDITRTPQLLFCNQHSCCWSKYRITRVSLYEYEIELIDKSPTEYIFCDDDSDINPDPFHCFYICDWNPIIARKVIQNDKNAISIIKSKDNLIIQPNPADDNLTITVKSEIEGKLALVIFDNLGNQVYFNEFENFRNINTVNINISDYPAGIYLISAYIDDKIITAGKVSIMR